MKSICYKIYKRLVVVCEKLKHIVNRDDAYATNEMPIYKNCLNCGEELVGMYCHKCGQHASPPVMKMSEFIKGYIRNLFSVENQAIPTLINLILRPGKIAKEFSEGRYASYVNPLNLNFFILVVLTTIFSIVGTDDKVKDSFKNITDKEIFIVSMSLSSMVDDEGYMARVEESPRSSIKIISSQSILEKYPQLVEIQEVIGLSDDHLTDTLVVSIPTIFIDDKFLAEKDGTYHFVKAYGDSDEWGDIVAEMRIWWEEAMSLIFAHFPLFILLTTPFFVFPLRLLLRKRKYTLSNLYIFSLYYIAFVELMLTILFIGGVIFGYTASSVSWFLRIALFLYLAVALKNAYEIKSWLLSLLYAVVVNVIYIVTTLVAIAVVVFIAIIVLVM